MNHFKGRVTRWCNLWEHCEFDWQARYHEPIIIIRDLTKYRAIIAYVQNNIAAWEAVYANPGEPFIAPHP